MKNILAPSILAADFCELGNQIKTVEQSGAEYLHFDVMDGMFVPSISFGTAVLQSIKKSTKLYMDVHLMIVNPVRYVEVFAKAGADLITFHIEACETAAEIEETIKTIKELDCEVGVSIKPNTPIEAVQPYLSEIDMVLIMSVEPGFGGQSFIPESLEKISGMRKMIEDGGYQIDIQVDGGIYLTNVTEVLEAGANIIVAGSAVFGGDAGENTKAFMEILQNV